jgi:MoaD family protein
MTTKTQLAEIEVRVPSMLRSITEGEKVVRVTGGNVREVLDGLTQRYPGLGERLFGPEGALRQFVNIYVNDEDIGYLDKLETPVSAGDEIAILPAVAGGA